MSSQNQKYLEEQMKEMDPYIDLDPDLVYTKVLETYNKLEMHGGVQNWKLVCQINAKTFKKKWIWVQKT